MIAIPTRPGVPIVINGCDASYAVVEGDWGLARPGHGAITVYGCAPLLPNRVYSERNSYHPRYGRPPPRGRNEIEPPPDRMLPEPAESYSRSWSTSSDPGPAVIQASPGVATFDGEGAADGGGGAQSQYPTDRRRELLRDRNGRDASAHHEDRPGRQDGHDSHGPDQHGGHHAGPHHGHRSTYFRRGRGSHRH